jgi:hypothetical protein
MTTLTVRRAATRTAALPVARVVAAAFSLSAGLVHLVYTPDHWWVWWGYGLFFLAAGLLQTALGALLLARRPPVAVTLAAIAGNAGIVVVYAISRTPYGALLGPMRGHSELPGLVDMATTMGELVTVVALLSLLSRRAVGRVTTLLLLVGAGLWLLRLTGQLVY